MLSANFVPVIAILMASKTMPKLDTGSQMPMLISVLIVPRLLSTIEETYDLTGLPAPLCWVITGLFSVMQFSTIVQIGQHFGYFKPAGEDKIGTRAAPVDQLEYAQGTPVDVARPGSVKVIEFWATWCGPCEKAIPKLNALVKKLHGEHGEDKVQFVGITNEGKDKVEPFLEKMKGQMDYNVAMDTNMDTYSTYPTSGIPHAYVVGKDGKICWSGHPMSGMHDAIVEALEADLPVAGTAQSNNGDMAATAAAAAAPKKPAAAPGPKKAVIVD